MVPGNGSGGGGGGSGTVGESQRGVMSHPQRKASPTTGEVKPPAKGEGGPAEEKGGAVIFFFFSQCQSSFYLK